MLLRRLHALPALVVLAFSLASPALAAAAASDSGRPLIIGTGAVTGIYFPAAGAVQRLVNDQNIGIRLAVESTNGSIANLQALNEGKLDLAIAQSDWAYYASRGGQVPFAQPDANLKVLLALHAEQMAVLVKSDSGINDLDGLKGRRINLGPANSGPRTIMTALLQTLGWNISEMGALLDLPFGEQSAALCDGKVDAIVFLVPHPNAAVQEALSRCATKLLPLTGPTVSQLIANNPFYAKSSIPGSTYARETGDVATFGVRALLVGGNSVSDDVAYAIAKAAFSNIALLNTLHPSLARLTAADLKADSFGLPLHPGVAKYLAENGLATPPAKAP